MCFIGCLTLAFPRLAFIAVWLLGDGYLSRAIDSAFLLLIGFLMLPTTTLAFAWASNSQGAPGDVTPLGWLVTGVALLIDLGLFGGGGESARRARRRRNKG